MRKSVWIIVAMMALVLTTGCQSGQSRQAMGSVFGTIYGVKYESGVDLNDSIIGVFESVNGSLSAFREGSIVDRLNRGEEGVKADDLFRHVLERSKEISRLSEGMFDPSVGPLIEAWGFGKNKEARQPGDEEIDSLLAMVGIEGIEIDSEGRITKDHAGMELNFSAIAKGYAADLVGEMLRRNGVENYLVEIGGEIVARGHSPRNADGWTIGLEGREALPGDLGGESHGVGIVTLSDRAIATSGNYRNFHTIGDSVVVGHTISPVTGRPVITRTVMATVVAEDCLTADALATACMAMEAEQALAMVEGIRGAEALLVVGDEGEIVRTTGFPEVSGY